MRLPRRRGQKKVPKGSSRYAAYRSSKHSKNMLGNLNMLQKMVASAVSLVQDVADCSWVPQIRPQKSMRVKPCMISWDILYRDPSVLPRICFFRIFVMSSVVRTFLSAVSQIIGKNKVFRDFSTFSRTCIFFLLTLSLF